MARRTAHRRPANLARSTTLFGRSALRLMSGVSERQLLLWEHERLIEPVPMSYDAGPDEPLYDAAALRRVRLIRTLAEELEVNLAGIDVILHLLDQLEG